jgi:hypothetical protein
MELNVPVQIFTEDFFQNFMVNFKDFPQKDANGPVKPSCTSPQQKNINLYVA